MRESTKRKCERAQALVAGGASISAACREAGVVNSQFYTWKKSFAGVVGSNEQGGEASLEEQVIASNLTARAKVKILSTLLNA